MKYILTLLIFCSVYTPSYSQQTDTAIKNQKYYSVLLKLQKPYTTSAAWSQEAINTVQRHFIYYQEMETSGQVLFGGRADYKEDNPDMFGIIVLKCSSKDEAEKIMKNDPAIVANIMHGTVHPFVIAYGNKENK
jgi:uncharacterized protein